MKINIRMNNESEIKMLKGVSTNNVVNVLINDYIDSFYLINKNRYENNLSILLSGYVNINDDMIPEILTEYEKCNDTLVKSFAESILVRYYANQLANINEVEEVIISDKKYLDMKSAIENESLEKKASLLFLEDLRYEKEIENNESEIYLVPINIFCK